MSCDHLKTVRRLVRGPWNDEAERYDEVWANVEEPAFVDDGLHFYKCEKCNQRFAYSERGPEMPEHDLHGSVY